MSSPEELSAYRDSGPWRLRVTERGDAALLGVWREHLDVLAIRGIWGGVGSIAAFVADACALARAHDLGRVMSPLVPLWGLEPYEAAEMTLLEAIVAIQGTPRTVRGAEVPPGVELRIATPEDLTALLELDAACFDEFWRYGRAELVGASSTSRLVVAQDSEAGTDGARALIGYTLATVDRGAATLARLAVAPFARRRGVGAALLSEVAAWAHRAGATTLSLCTQESNQASRSLYSEAGLQEVEGRYGFAACEARTGVAST